MENSIRKSTINRGLRKDTLLYQGICLPCKNDQGYFDPNQKSFIESIPFEKVNTDEKRSKPQDHNNIDGIENKITRFQIYLKQKSLVKTPQQFSKHKIQKFLSKRKSFILKTGKRNIKPAHPYQNHKLENLISR